MVRNVLSRREKERQLRGPKSVTSQTQFKDRQRFNEENTHFLAPPAQRARLTDSSLENITNTHTFSVNQPSLPNLSHQWLHQAEFHWKTFHLSIPTFKSNFVVLLISNISE